MVIAADHIGNAPGSRRQLDSGIDKLIVAGPQFPLVFTVTEDFASRFSSPL
jgi:hypothetical protein